MKNNIKPIYLDNNSTTKIDPKVLNEMMPFLIDTFGNPSSMEHLYGLEANEFVEIARERISKFINSSPGEIIFTSGATESNNIAILGYFNSLDCNDFHALTVKTEHKSVIEIFKYLSQRKIKVDYLDVMNDGIININQLKKMITSKTKIISVMMANNEIGVIQPIKEIGEICRKKKIFFHVDAAQAIGKINVDINALNIDAMSISAHKLYGPKGIGCLYINDKNKLLPIYHGGRHEKGLRPGTLAVHNIVGFGHACEIAQNNIKTDKKRINQLTSYMIDKLKTAFPDIIINGNLEKRIPGNINISFPMLEYTPLISNLSKIAISSGASCSSLNPTPSHVLKALGLNKSLIKSTIRMGIGRFNTEKEIKDASNYIISVINKLSKKHLESC